MSPTFLRWGHAASTAARTRSRGNSRKEGQAWAAAQNPHILGQPRDVSTRDILPSSVSPESMTGGGGDRERRSRTSRATRAGNPGSGSIARSVGSPPDARSPGDDSAYSGRYPPGMYTPGIAESSLQKPGSPPGPGP